MEKVQMAMGFPEGCIVSRLGKASLALALGQEAWAKDHGDSRVMEGMTEAYRQIRAVLDVIGLPDDMRIEGRELPPAFH